MLRFDSLNPGALGVLGRAAILRGDFQRGLTLLLKAVDHDKNNAGALTHIGTIYLFQLGEPTKGVMFLKRLREIEPTDWMVNSNLGAGFAMLKEYPEAIQAFHRAAELNPDHDFPRYQLGYVF